MRCVPPALLLVGLASCSKPEQPPPSRTVEAVTRAEAETFGRDLANLIAACDRGLIDSQVDRTIFFDRAIAGRILTKDERTSVERTVGISRRLCAGPSQSRFVHVQQSDGTPRPVIRLEPTLDYARFELLKIDGTVHIVDLFTFHGGQHSTLVNQMLADAKAAQKSFVDFGRLLGQHRYNGALAAYYALPPSLRASKQMMLRAIDAAFNVDKWRTTSCANN